MMKLVFDNEWSKGTHLSLFTLAVENFDEKALKTFVCCEIKFSTNSKIKTYTNLLFIFLHKDY